MRTPTVLLTCLLVSPFLGAQTWEVAPTGIWTTQTSSSYWDQGTAGTWGLRGSWLAPRNDANRLRVDAGWMPSTSWSALGADGVHAHVRAQSFLIGLGRESWFMADRFCFSVALDLRHTWLETTQASAPRITNHLPQVWMRVGVGARIWAFNASDRRASDEPPRYALLRLELGEAAPRGPSTTDELLPQREVTLSGGLRF